MPKLTDLLGRPHSGIVPTAVIGIVKDNDDPDQLGRVQVTFPTLYVSDSEENPVSFWMRVMSPDAGSATGSLDGKGQQEVDSGKTQGSGRGFYSVPEIHDEVLVLFTQGSQDVGVVIGQLYNGADGPPDEAIGTMPSSDKLWNDGSKSTDKFTDGSTDDEKNDRRLWKSRSGSLIVFDDTKDKESVQIWNNDHTLALVFSTKDERIILSNSKGDIHIRTAKDLYLEAGENIYWETGKNFEGHAGENMKETAEKNMDLKAVMDASLKADMNAMVGAGIDLGFDIKAAYDVAVGTQWKAKAPMTELEGSALTKIKGGLVKIN